MTEPRRVVVTVPAIRGLTVLEVARASVTAGVKRADTERLLRTLVDGSAEPEDLERGALLLYAWAYHLVRRDEPGVTWDDAQTWRVELDVTVTDELADAEAHALVEAALATGLTPAEAGELTVAQLGMYAELGSNGGRQG